MQSENQYVQETFLERFRRYATMDPETLLTQITPSDGLSVHRVVEHYERTRRTQVLLALGRRLSARPAALETDPQALIERIAARIAATGRSAAQIYAEIVNRQNFGWYMPVYERRRPVGVIRPPEPPQERFEDRLRRLEHRLNRLEERLHRLENLLNRLDELDHP